MSEAIPHVHKSSVVDKQPRVLIRIIPGKRAKRRAFLDYIMEAGRFAKGTQEMARLLLQRTYTDNSPIYEVCAVREAFSKITVENPKDDPRRIFAAGVMPAFMEELEDLAKTRIARGTSRRDMSFDALIAEARQGDLLLSADDEHFLATQIAQGHAVTQPVASDQFEARFSSMELMIQRLVLAQIGNRDSVAATGQNAQPTHTTDPYKTNLAPAQPTRNDAPLTAAEIQDQGLAEALPENLQAKDDTPDHATVDAALKGDYTLEKALEEEDAAEKAAEKAALAKKLAQKSNSKGRRRKKVPKLGRQRV